CVSCRRAIEPGADAGLIGAAPRTPAAPLEPSSRRRAVLRPPAAAAAARGLSRGPARARRRARARDRWHANARRRRPPARPRWRVARRRRGFSGAQVADRARGRRGTGRAARRGAARFDAARPARRVHPAQRRPPADEPDPGEAARRSTPLEAACAPARGATPAIPRNDALFSRGAEGRGGPAPEDPRVEPGPMTLSRRDVLRAAAAGALASGGTMGGEQMLT